MEDAIRRDAHGGSARAQYRLSEIEFKRGNKGKALRWLKKSAARDFPDACFSMATFQIAGVSVPYDAVGARRNVGKAAEQGHADAQLLLSQMLRSGYGGARDVKMANSRLLEVARKGHPMALCGVAMLLHIRDRQCAAAELLLDRAALGGSHIAAYVQAEKRRQAALDGDIEARNDRIRYLFLSARAGNKLAEAELVEHDKSVVRAVLDKASFSPPENCDVNFAEVAEVLDQDVQYAFGQSEILSGESDVLIFRGFMTPLECGYMRAAAAPAIRPSSTVHPVTGELVRNEIRTSSSSNFDPVSRDHFIISVDERIAAATDTAVEQGEPLNVLFYRIAEEYKFHYDFLSPGNEDERKLLEEGGQRKYTFLVSLNGGYTGGETRFPKLDVSYRGRIGDALMFRNIDGDGQPNRKMLHAGMPVTGGSKWVASKWIRENAFSLGAPARS